MTIESSEPSVSERLHLLGYQFWCLRGFLALFLSLSWAEWEPGYRISPVTAWQVAWGIWLRKRHEHHCECDLASPNFWRNVRGPA